jgi:hypothetical protein
MSIREYRIPLPLSVEEYRIAQLYTAAKFSKENTAKETREGVEIVENKPFEDGERKGQYTKKVIRMGSHIPDWIKSWVPANLLAIEEEAWNSYPNCKTVYTNKYMGDKFSIVIKSAYLPDAGTTENALHLTDDQIKTRVIDKIDILCDPIDKSKYKEEEDPAIWASKKTGRGKLKTGWQDEAVKSGVVMCSYKVVLLELNSWMLSSLFSKFESFIHTNILRAVLTLGHRQAYTWMDEWHGLTIEDIRKIEAETKKLLDERLAEAKATESQAPNTTQTIDQQQQQQAQQTTPQNGPQESKAKGWMSGWWKMYCYKL